MIFDIWILTAFIPQLSFLLAVLSLALVVVFVISVLIVRLNPSMVAVDKFAANIFISAVLFGVLSCLLPSKNVGYAILGAKYGEKIINSDQVSDAVASILSRIDSQNKYADEVYKNQLEQIDQFKRRREAIKKQSIESNGVGI